MFPNSYHITGMSKLEEVVHIIPVGYEIDRIVKPFEVEGGYKPNRVYLLSSTSNDVPVEIRRDHEKYVKIVQEKLEGLGIIVDVMSVNLIDLRSLMGKISYLILHEKKQGNLVYVNMSGAGRLTSVASTLAGMAHGANVYYVESDGYAVNDPRMETHGYTIVEQPRTLILENFDINLPNEIQLTALVKIVQKGSMRTTELIEYLGSEGYGEYMRYSKDLPTGKRTGIIMKLNRNVIEKLLEQKCIEKIKYSRENKYVPTETGKYVASISGLLKKRW